MQMLNGGHLSALALAAPFVCLVGCVLFVYFFLCCCCIVAPGRLCLLHLLLFVCLYNVCFLMLLLHCCSR